MPPKSKRSRKALRSLREIYTRKQLRKLLKMIMSAAMSSPEADTWPSVTRGEAFAFYSKLQKIM